MARCIETREADGRDSTGCFFDKMIGDVEVGGMGGSEEGCYLLGKLYETGVIATELKPSIFRARALFKSACDQGEVRACADEAAYYAREELLLEEPADPKRAFSLVWKACTGETLRGAAQLKRPGGPDNGLAILDLEFSADVTVTQVWLWKHQFERISVLMGMSVNVFQDNPLGGTELLATNSFGPLRTSNTAFPFPDLQVNTWQVEGLDMPSGQIGLQVAD